MPGSSLFSVAVIGLLAGALSRRLVGGRQSLFASLGLGLAGALLGTLAASLLGLPLTGLAGVAAAALAGAVTLVAIAGLIPKR